MEPLSAALTIISVATTLSSLIDLAVNLRDSFQKISQNRKAANRLATGIVTDLQQLQGFYEENSKILENSAAIKAAVCNLQREMQTVYFKCRALTPNQKFAQWHKVVTAFNSWVNRNKVEEEIKQLKMHIMLCYVQFTTFATARIEVSTQKIYDISTKLETHLTLTDQTPILAFQKIETGRLHANTPFGPNFSNSHQLCGRTAADVYLSNEIAALDQTLKDLSKAIVISTDKVGPYRQSFRPIIHVKPLSTDQNIQSRNVIMQTLEILQILHNNPSHSLSFQQGGWGLVNLCISLYQIGHYSEAIVVGAWAVRLFRSLVDVDRNAYYPYLALALHNLSHCYISNGDEKEALISLTECLEIGRRLQQKEDITPEVHGLFARSLVASAKISAAGQDYQRSFEESREAVKTCEDILLQLMNRQREDLVFEETCASPNPAHDIIQHGTDSQLHLWASSHLSSEEVNEVVLPALHGYGQALHQFSCSLHRLGRFLEAISAGTKALQVFRLISHENPVLFETEVLEILSSLTHNDFRVFIPIATSMAYIQESIIIYRRLAAIDPASYCKSLYDALYTKATLLRSMEKYVEEVQAWEEVVNQGQLIQNHILVANALYQMSWSLRHLNKFQDAAASRREAIKAYRLAFNGPSHLEANAYYEFAVDLELADLPDLAAISAQEAVNQYRILTLTGHDSCTEPLADSLTLLANISLRTLDFDRALEKGGDALALYRVLSTQAPDSEFTTRYAHCLDINMTAAFQSNDEERALERGRLVVELFEELSIRDADSVGLGLVDTWETYGHLLNKHDRPTDARPWIEKALEWYNAQSVGDIQADHIASLCTYGSILDDQGFPEQALQQAVKAVNLAKDLAHSNPSFVSLYYISNVHQIDHLLELGRYQEALAISRESIAFIREGRLGDSWDIIDCFLIHATALNFNNEPEAAISILNEAIALSQTHLIAYTSETQRDTAQVQLAHALHLLSESLADSGKESEALSYARQSVNQIQEVEGSLLALPSPRMRYLRALFSTNLSCRLAASGDYQASIDVLTEAKTFYETNVHIRNGYSIELARVYRLLGLLHCAQGQHEAGVATFALLKTLRERLLEETPDLAHYVDIYLQHEDRRPSWLKSLHSKLDCSESHHPTLSNLLS